MTIKSEIMKITGVKVWMVEGVKYNRTMTGTTYLVDGGRSAMMQDV